MNSKPRGTVSDFLERHLTAPCGRRGMMNAKQIRRDRIVPDPEQPRKTFPRRAWKNWPNRWGSVASCNRYSLRHSRRAAT